MTDTSIGNETKTPMLLKGSLSTRSTAHTIAITIAAGARKKETIGTALFRGDSPKKQICLSYS